MTTKTVRFFVYEHPVTGEEIDDYVDYAFPAKWVVCYDCGGDGTTYLGWSAGEQPAFTSEDFYEDPDFAEDYFGGFYDKQCPACKGRTTILEIEEKFLNEEQAAFYKAYCDDQYEEYLYQREVEAERRFGC